MTAATADFTDLVQHALKEAKAQAPRAVDDLRRCASQAADAVARVTGGVGALELVPINQSENAKTTYQLQLRKVNSEAPPIGSGCLQRNGSGIPDRTMVFSRGLGRTSGTAGENLRQQFRIRGTLQVAGLDPRIAACGSGFVFAAASL